MAVSTTLDMTAMNAALKELIEDQEVTNLVYSDNPLFAMLPKKTDFGGKYKPVPLMYGNSQGRSSKFSTAQGNTTAAQLKEFLVTSVSLYSVAQIDNKTLEASATDKMAFISAAKLARDSAFSGAANDISAQLFGGGTGTLAQLGSISSGVITLADPASVVFFEVNMALQANQTDGGTPRAAKGYVIAVDRQAGTVTVSATLGGSAGTPTGWAANDFLLQDGTAPGDGGAIAGLAAWIPSTVTATPFFGVDRSADPTRLGGIRYDGSAQSVEEALVDASLLAAREGGKPTICVTNFASYSALVKALGSKVVYSKIESKIAGIGFKGVEITGANSTITVIPDRSCQGKTAWLLDMRSWAFESLGDAPKVLTSGAAEGGLLRMASADAAELRVGTYGQLTCAAPGWNVRVALGV